MKLLKQPMEIDVEALASSVARKKLERQLRALNVDGLNIGRHLCHLESYVILKKNLLNVKERLVRFYSVSGYDFSSRDNGSASDPYLIVECNGKSVNERDNYIVDEPNPDFYKRYDFEAKFPGCAPLVVKAMDYDPIFGDELIGTTIVDLEDRFFSMDWQSLGQKPIEYR